MISMISEDEVVKRFGEGFDCASVVLTELSADVGLTEDQAKKISSCFGVGMMQGTVCGAVSAAFMALGYRYGNTEPNDTAQKGLVLAKREEFLKRFTEANGAILCPQLLNGLDMRVPEEAKKAVDDGLTKTVCPKICISSINIVRDIL